MMYQHIEHAEEQLLQESGGFGKVIPGTGWQGVDGSADKAIVSSQALHLTVETMMFLSCIYGFTMWHGASFLHHMVLVYIFILSIGGMLFEMNFNWHIFKSFRNWLGIWFRWILTPVGRAIYLLAHSLLGIAMFSSNYPLGLTSLFAVMIAALDFALHVGFRRELADLGMNITVTEQPPGVYSGPGYKPPPAANKTLQSYRTAENLAPSNCHGGFDMEQHDLPDFGSVQDIQDPYFQKYHPSNNQDIDKYRQKFGP